MKQDALQGAEKYTKAHQRKKRWYRVVTCLAAVVVFCTTYALILPAITLEKKCEIPEHTHTEACYTQVTTREKRNLTCAVEADVVIHHHDSACYDEDGNLWCPLSEIETHAHTESCYALPETDAPEVHTHTADCYTVERGELTCTEHVHADACYTETSALICSLAESDGHQHGESCQNEAGEILCGIEASEGHHHDGSCYETSRELTCGVDSDHRHSDDCHTWDRVLTCDLPTEPDEVAAEPAEPVLVCGKAEILLHEHTDSCLDESGNLICGKTQVLSHQHTASCFETVEEPVDTTSLTCTLPEDENHTHVSLCYGTWELTCTLEEHTHSEACMPTEPEQETEPVYICGKGAHTHNETCLDENGNHICGLEEHTHSLACYSDPTADVETAEIWEQTFAGVTLTGNWRQDAVSIAQTQLGYTESTKNYMVAEDGETVKGYTRYGAWYGEPYADWDTMFLSFCLHYAGVEDVPMDANCGSWSAAWADGFVPAQSHETAAGDLVFFDRDGDGIADHAGLVTQITDSGFTAIEGDAEEAVRLLSYGADDSAILGYVNLPEEAKEFTLTAQSETGITVTITGDSASLPYPAREITVAVKEVTDEESIAIRDRLLGEEAAEPERSFLLDITLWHGEEEIEPTGPVTVAFGGFDTDELYPKVFHIDTVAQTATDMEAEKEENGDVTIATDHFSVFAIQFRSARQIQGFIGNELANGGEFILSGDAFTEENGSNAHLNISQDTTIDLNGHILYISKSHQCFEVQNGATLTITDTATVSDNVTYPGGTLYGNKASLDDSTLTYYITKSTASGTGTTETLEKHEVTLSSVGRIVCSEASAQTVLVNGGTLKIQGGLLNSNNKGGRVVCVESGTLTMEGGYLVGGSKDIGGGVYSKGTVNMSGGVIAANHANAGGGIYVNGGTVNISGGAVAGNWVNDGCNNGGGIYVASGTLNLSGTGYVTNNYKNICCYNDANNTHGGGGITLAGSSAMNMTGGYVTGNFSGLAGGGIYAGFFGGTAQFTMSGGTIARNNANQGEGGGIRIAGGTKGVLSATSGKAYITNNSTDTPNDWGGGGIFVQEKGYLTVINGLITSNSAGGYGGGVAACPTGETLIVHMEGAAIYGNTDQGQNMSGGGNGKNADTNVAKSNNTFTSNGHKDYFCVRHDGSNPISLVTGEMPGGGAANWTGSSDGQPITISKTGYATANYLFGLAANPDADAISAAQKVATIIISGNHSNVHGGGIMTNGGLIIGRPEAGVVTTTPALHISGTKALLKDGVSQSGGLDFHFQLKDNNGNEVGTAIANASTGKFTISPNTNYSQAGTYTYTLSEVSGSRPGVTYDASEYTIQVTIGKKDVTLLNVTFTSYNVDSVIVSKTGGADTTEPTQPDTQPDTHPNTFRVHFKNSDNWEGVNLYIWDGNGVPNSNGWPGDQVNEDPAHPGWYTREFTVSGSGKFICKFNCGDSYQKEFQISFSPGDDLWAYADGSSTTTAPDDWNGGSSGSNVSFTGTKNSDGSYSLEIHGDAFTNTITTLMNLQIRKTDSNDDDKVLKGATFSLKKPGEATGTEATTDENGIATFEGIGRNTTYYLYETMPPANYMTAGPWILEVKESTATLYPAAEGDNGTLTKTSDTGTALHVSGSDPIVLTATISDQSWGYELPNTGGAGTQLYTMGGCLLTAGAVYLLLYSHRRRRKEDAVSS